MFSRIAVTDPTNNQQGVFAYRPFLHAFHHDCYALYIVNQTLPPLEVPLNVRCSLMQYLASRMCRCQLSYLAPVIEVYIYPSEHRTVGNVSGSQCTYLSYATLLLQWLRWQMVQGRLQALPAIPALQTAV